MEVLPRKPHDMKVLRSQISAIFIHRQAHGPMTSNSRKNTPQPQRRLSRPWRVQGLLLVGLEPKASAVGTRFASKRPPDILLKFMFEQNELSSFTTDVLPQAGSSMTGLSALTSCFLIDPGFEAVTLSGHGPGRTWTLAEIQEIFEVLEVAHHESLVPNQRLLLFYFYLCVCFFLVCVCPTLDKGSYPTTFTQAGGQWTTITHCPTKTVMDRS